MELGNHMENMEMKLAEFICLNQSIKDLTKRLEERKEELKRLGTFVTDGYICVVEDQKRTGLGSLEEVLRVVDRQFLDAFGLIKTSTFKTVKVSKKP